MPGKLRKVSGVKIFSYGQRVSPAAIQGAQGSMQKMPNHQKPKMEKRGGVVCNFKLTSCQGNKKYDQTSQSFQRVKEEPNFVKLTIFGGIRNNSSKEKNSVISKTSN
jgi:hypothetical protein